MQRIQHATPFIKDICILCICRILSDRGQERAQKRHVAFTEKEKEREREGSDASSVSNVSQPSAYSILLVFFMLKILNFRRFCCILLFTVEINSSTFILYFVFCVRTADVGIQELNTKKYIYETRKLKLNLNFKKLPK
jgi:hypothetical protein